MPSAKQTPPSYVGFGMLTPVYIMALDQLPKHNTGAIVHQVSEYVYDDAAIIACNLRQWNVPTGMIGTSVGDDLLGHHIENTLKNMGVQGKVRFTKKYKTPLEVNVSDKLGARTYFWQRSPEILSTLDTADLGMLKDADLMYVDWYDGDHIIRAMNEARRCGVPVFLNLEHGHRDPEIMEKYVSRATICQAVTDDAQIGRKGAMLTVAKKLLKAGIKTAIITMARQGCMVVQGDEIIRVYAPKVKAVDGSGAGATFSSGFIYGHLKGWGLEETVRFAIAAASLKVTRSGLKMFPISEIKKLAASLSVERMEYRDNQFFELNDLISQAQKSPLVKESKKLAEKLMLKKKTERKKIKKSLVE
ncbi:MAG TPA: carbohydrate kinase family protein [Anaerolineales bacterium]|nr:carbohydrate kinase family protein [Anaerolineales bacterium]HMX20716.1 carbohydrate kinase family protein [Anaerolineales bacterium]HMX73475.1 carbohydrate kinase family protein [Anaerolineales bacterium]HNA55729.1 carbohydrate kinase family protein [Anaerolineales bacterium]HNC90530.1 carbohydrate kinase family protein [Anaerolineales bacterium]